MKEFKCFLNIATESSLWTSGAEDTFSIHLMCWGWPGSRTARWTERKVCWCASFLTLSGDDLEWMGNLQGATGGLRHWPQAAPCSLSDRACGDICFHSGRASALNKACNHTVVTVGADKATHRERFSLLFFPLSEMSVSAYLISAYQQFYIKSRMKTNSYVRPAWLITGPCCTSQRGIYSRSTPLKLLFHTPACNFLRVNGREKGMELCFWVPE